MKKHFSKDTKKQILLSLDILISDNAKLFFKEEDFEFNNSAKTLQLSESCFFLSALLITLDKGHRPLELETFQTNLAEILSKNLTLSMLEWVMKISNLTQSQKTSCSLFFEMIVDSPIDDDRAFPLLSNIIKHALKEEIPAIFEKIINKRPSISLKTITCLSQKEQEQIIKNYAASLLKICICNIPTFSNLHQNEATSLLELIYQHIGEWGIKNEKGLKNAYTDFLIHIKSSPIFLSLSLTLQHQISNDLFSLCPGNLSKEELVNQALAQHPTLSVSIFQQTLTANYLFYKSSTRYIKDLLKKSNRFCQYIFQSIKLRQSKM